MCERTPGREPRHEVLRAEVETWLRDRPREMAPEVSHAYIGGRTSKLEYLGLKVPSYVAVLKAPLAMNALPEAQAAGAWHHLFMRSRIYEAMAAAQAWFLQPKRFAVGLSHWPLFVEWVGRLDNWAHSDSLSKLVAKCLEDDSATVLPVLRRWNASDDPWEQRQSMVGLIYYASGRKRILPFATLLPFVERHVEGDHFYVKKAVGWTLRELWNAYPRETEDWLERNIGRIGAYAFSASTEKMPPARKAAFKALRMAERKASTRKAGPERTKATAKPEETRTTKKGTK